MDWKNMQNGLKRKIKIYFPRENSSGWLGGVNYFKNLLYALSLVNNNEFEPYLSPKNPKELFRYAKKINGIIFIKDKFAHKILGKKYDRNTSVIKRVDIFSHCYKPYSDVCSISWIPDFQHLYLPDMFEKKELEQRDAIFKDIAKNATLVILSSYDALNDFKKFAPEFAHKGRVLNFVSYINPKIYDLTDRKSQEIKSKLELPEKYFYVPNQFWKHKNHITVLKAVSELKKQGIDIKIVFSGHKNDYRDKGFFGEIAKFIEENNIQENVKILGIIELEEVFYLMRNCIFIINPSLFEGWSSTVEEAKSLGKNIILSDLNVHKEQNPPNALYFSALDDKQLAEILKEKWQSNSFGPDFELEKSARENMLARMKKFGKEYKQILYEAFELYKNK